MTKIQETMATSAKSGIICFFEGSFLPPSCFSPFWAGKIPISGRANSILVEEDADPIVAVSQDVDAHNLADLATHFGKQHQDRFISDPNLLNAMMPPLSRTVLFSINQEAQEKTKTSTNQLLLSVINFLYFLPSEDGDVIRIELPNWLLASSKHNHVLNIIIAEYFQGLHWPLTMSTAANQANASKNDKTLFSELSQIL